MKKILLLMIFCFVNNSNILQAQSWQVLALPWQWTYRYNPVICFSDTATGCVGGYGIIKTTDAGNTWTQVLDGNALEITAITLKGQVGYASGHPVGWFGSFIYKTTNQGSNWIMIQYIEHGVDFGKISIINENSAIVTVNGDTEKYIWSTTNGGQSWDTVFSTPEIHIVSALFNETKQYALTSDNFWINMGGSWVLRDNVSTTNMSNIEISQNKIFFGGQKFNNINQFQFVVTKTTDEGISWHYSVLNSDYSGVCRSVGSQGNTIYAAGYTFTDTSSSARLYKSTEDIWTQVIELPDNTWFWDMSVTSSYIYISGRGYIVRYNPSDIPLPVELSSFTSAVKLNTVILNWTTTSETNNSEFQIQKKNNNNDWRSIGSVTGNGTSSLSHHYQFTDRNVVSGQYSYRLKQIDYNGNFEYHNLSQEVVVGIPSTFTLSQNYPNPFNPSTTISYSLPADSKVNLIIYDMVGKEVTELLNEAQRAGYHTISFNGSNLSSGIYYYRLTTDNMTDTKKMMLIK